MFSFTSHILKRQAGSFRASGGRGDEGTERSDLCRGGCCRASERAGKGDQSRCRCCSREESVGPTLRKQHRRLQAGSVLPVRENGVVRGEFCLSPGLQQHWELLSGQRWGGKLGEQEARAQGMCRGERAGGQDTAPEQAPAEG